MGGRNVLPEDPLWRPRLTPPPGLVARYQPSHLLAVAPPALAFLLAEPQVAEVARRALPTLPVNVRAHVRDSLGPSSLETDVSEAAGWPDLVRCLAWDLLYWNEPDLYDRLTEGEALHFGLLRDLNFDRSVVLDVGAGSGRLTLLCAVRASKVYALEPATPLREVLSRKLKARHYSNVEMLPGWSNRIPLEDGSVDLALSASAFGAIPSRGGDVGLRELFRVVRPGGRIAVLWPDDPSWFLSRGFEYHAYGGAMEVRFRDLETAAACAEIFYPSAALEHIRRTGRPVVPFDLIGVNAPRDLCTRGVA